MGRVEQSATGRLAIICRAYRRGCLKEGTRRGEKTATYRRPIGCAVVPFAASARDLSDGAPMQLDAAPIVRFAGGKGDDLRFAELPLLLTRGTDPSAVVQAEFTRPLQLGLQLFKRPFRQLTMSGEFSDLLDGVLSSGGVAKRIVFSELGSFPADCFSARNELYVTLLKGDFGQVRAATRARATCAAPLVCVLVGVLDGPNTCPRRTTSVHRRMFACASSL